ncbi:MAG: hypothetical protein M1828_006021 [Chrysothrix sp. TS-e1954]|nr:MAG: hypothetical protein M1828_006021 [Chrysothrix sp. TS-e1954]
MPTLPMEEWHTQSRLLLEARPATTRISTTYSRSISSRARKRREAASTLHKSANAATTQQAASSEASIAPPATLTLKTYDTASGVCLKYKTDKGAEVGRLIASLGQMGRKMAALPEDERMSEATTLAPVEDVDSGAVRIVAEQHARGDALEKDDVAAPSRESKGVAGGGGGGVGGKKKKKGKR